MAAIKHSFYEILRHLAARPEHFAAVTLGASCEAWCNAEAFAALTATSARILLPGQVLRQEQRKRDLVFLDADGVRQVIEVKLLYPWTESKLRREKLAPLRTQVERRALNDGDRTRYTGLIIAIWTSNYAEPPRAFFRRVSELLANTFPSDAYTTQHGYRLEPIIRDQKIMLSGAEYVVHSRAAYVTLRRGTRN